MRVKINLFNTPIIIDAEPVEECIHHFVYPTPSQTPFWEDMAYCKKCYADADPVGETKSIFFCESDDPPWSFLESKEEEVVARWLTKWWRGSTEYSIPEKAKQLLAAGLDVEKLKKQGV